jgi:L-seryl-tRNA(Ser) seleniumtransferase
MSPNPLRNLPSVNEVLENPRLRGLVDRISHNAVVRTARKVIDEITSEVHAAATEKTLPSVTDLAERIARRVVDDEVPRLRSVINATGILLGDEFGAVPLAEDAVEEMATVARDYACVTPKPDSPSRQPAVEALLKECTGAEAALVVNHANGATMAALAALAAGKEVIVSRGQMADYDGSTLKEMAAVAGAEVCEVGSTNRTSADDYGQAIGEQTAAIVVTEPTNFAVIGATGSATLKGLLAMPNRGKTLVVHDLGIGGLVDPVEFGLGARPTATASLQAGADLVLMRGDKLLGGPPCGILLGRKSAIESIESHPMTGAMRVDEWTLAALAATLRLYRDKERVQHTVPLLELLSTSQENLHNRAKRLAPQIAACDVVATAEPVEESTYLAGISLPDCQLPTWCIDVQPAGISANRLAKDLGFEQPPLHVRLEGERLMLDLRSVISRQDKQIVAIFESLNDRE